MPSDEEVTQRAGSLGAMTGFTAQAFEALRPPFAHALLAYMPDQTSDGPPRTVRSSRTYSACPFPAIADKLRCLLTSVKQTPRQEGQGQRCGMSQSTAHTWIPRLHPVVHQAFAHHDLLPARTAAD